MLLSTSIGVYQHDLTTGSDVRLSQTSDGVAWISGDGGSAAVVRSEAPVPGDPQPPPGGPIRYGFDAAVIDIDTGDVHSVSVNSDGERADGDTWGAAISHDGRLVAFSSKARNLDPTDTNNWEDIYIHDVDTGHTELVSKGLDGTAGNGASMQPAISADGRFIAFASTSSDLVADDRNGKWDVFVRDRATETTVRASVGFGGLEQTMSDFWDIWPTISISADGRYVAFDSPASELVPDDCNGWVDVFVRDIVKQTTARVSVTDLGSESFSSILRMTSISDDGRFVAFESGDDIALDDTNRRVDAYVRDRGQAPYSDVPERDAGIVSQALRDAGRTIPYVGYQATEASCLTAKAGA